MGDHLNRVLKTVVLWRRRELATNLDHAREKTAHASLRASFDDMLKPFEDLIAEDWMSKTGTLRIPRVADFLTLESTEAHLGFGVAAVRREVPPAPGALPAHARRPLFPADVRPAGQERGPRIPGSSAPTTSSWSRRSVGADGPANG